MKDKEIIKALECCPLDDIGGCRKIDALDLINRQKAEIKSLTEKLEALGDPLQDAHYKIAEQQAEIEKLSNCVVMQENLIQEQRLAGERIAKMIIDDGKIKAEAIKEFEHKLFSYLGVGHLRPPTEKCFSEIEVKRMIERVGKEMVGDIPKIEHASLCETETYKVDK